MKRLVSIFFIIVFLLSACDSGDQEPAADTTATNTAQTQQDSLVEVTGEVVDPADYQFAVVYGGNHPYFYPYEPGAKAAAKDLKIPEPFVVSPQAWDQTEQNQVLDSVIAKGAKAIALFPSEGVAGNEKISKIVKNGIPCVTLGGSPALPTDALFCYATDVGKSAAYGTQMLIDKLKSMKLKKGKIVHLCSSLVDPNTVSRRNAIKEVLAKTENNGFVLYEELFTDDIEQSEKAVNTMFASYIGQVDGIICTAYVNSQVLAKTMTSRKEKRVVAICIDDAPDVLDAIDQGIVYGTMTQNPWGMGYVGIYALKLIKDGYTYKKDKPFFIDSGYFLLTKEGLPTYQQTVEANTQRFVSTMKDTYFDPPIE